MRKKTIAKSRRSSVENKPSEGRLLESGGEREHDLVEFDHGRADFNPYEASHETSSPGKSPQSAHCGFRLASNPNIIQGSVS